MIMRVKGSVTAWVCLTMFLVCQVILVFIEGARKCEIERAKQLETDRNLESVFAGYVKPLWDRYHILSWDENKIDYSEIEAESRTFSKQEAKHDLLEAALDETDWQRMLITDQKGLAYQKFIASYRGRYWTYQSIDKSRSECEKIEALEKESNGSLEYYMKDIRGDVMDGSMKLMSQIISGGIFQYAMLGDTVTLSKNEIEKDSCLKERTLKKGDIGINGSLSLVEKALFMDYVYSCFGNFRKVNKDTALQYEQEYLLCGYESDYENLLAVSNRLLVIRIAANLISLHQDQQKMNQAESYAEVLAALCMEPELAEVIKPMIVTSWAMAESVLDLRSLLQGDKLSIIKTSEEWTTSQYLLCEYYILSGQKAKCSTRGMAYEDYLKALLLTVSNENLAYRAMDMQEKSIQLLSGYEDFKMDNLVVAVKMECAYKANYWLLPSIKFLSNKTKDGYMVHCYSEYSYLNK